MKIIIDGKIGEEDLVLFARFLREMWRHRPDNLCVLIDPGMENLSSVECMDLFRRIFTMDDKDWKENKMTKKMYDEFKEKMKK